MIRNIYALLVGIDQYISPINPLKGCVNDINAVEEYLEGRQATDGYKLHTRILRNQDATYQAIIDGFLQHLCQASSEDIALFYFAGHGFQEQSQKEFWHLEPDFKNEALVCYDTLRDGNYGLADKELKYLIEKVAQNNPRIILILDCCHSGTGTRNIPLGVRLTSEDTRIRPLSSFIFANDETALDELRNSQRVNKKKTGLALPKGKHILMAACRDFQLAKEYKGEDDQHRGAFSYFLIDTLQRTNGNLSYRDLARNIEALVKGKYHNQVPQLEATDPEDLKECFLGVTTPARNFYFTLNYNSKEKEKDWEIDGGVLSGIPKTSNSDETTLLAIFQAGSTPEQLREVSAALGEARVKQVLTHKSKVEITQSQEQEPLSENKTYWAVVTSLPIESLKVYIKGTQDEEAGVALAKQALEKVSLGEQPSLYVKQVENPETADYNLLVRNGQYWITQPIDERAVTALIPKEADGSYTFEAALEAIRALEAIARWKNIINLKSPVRSQIDSNGIEMEITLTGYGVPEEDFEPYQGLNQSSTTASELRYEYIYKNGEWKPPVLKVKVTNHSDTRLYCNVLALSEDFSVSRLFYEVGSEVLPPKGSEASGTVETEIDFFIPDDFLNNGVTEYKDVLKLIVSTSDFDAKLLEQDGLEPPPQTRSLQSIEGTLDSLMQQVSTRNPGKSGRKYDDWVTKEVALTIVKPRDAEQIQPNQSTTLLNGLVEVQPHPSLQAQVSLTTVSQTTRDIGNLIVPSLLRDEPGVIESFQFTTSRGSDLGLSALEFFDVKDKSVVTPETPLILRVNEPLEEGEHLLPISYDGEFFLPLGRGVRTENGKTEIKLERLPQAMISSRSIGSSMRIFFKKIRSQKLGHSYEYPILAVAEVSEDGKEVIYEQDREKVKQLVANAQKIVLYIHGIIGDTRSLVGSVQTAKVEVNGQLCPLRELYDLVLTFDYENLNTTIEENARLLKQRLEEVGLGANCGKELHIVAHSMGGLVSRWFIEQEGGNQVVKHLVMLGTPNAGSPWSRIQDWAFAALGVGLNQVSTLVWPAEVVADLLDLLDANVKALDQMRSDSDFLQAITNNSEPQIPYTIIAGDRSLAVSQPQEQESVRLERLFAKLYGEAVDKVVDLAFWQEPNDIAVSLASIKSVSSNRSPQPKILTPDAACDHVTYFTSEAGLKALATALYPQPSSNSTSSS